MTTSLLDSPLENGGPRVRRGDRTASHIAADKSQRHMKQTKIRVLQLVLQESELTGSEINDLYELRAARNDWTKIHRDTPRKRAEELEKDGYLEIVRTETADGNHLPEAVYGITQKGREILGHPL